MMSRRLIAVLVLLSICRRAEGEDPLTILAQNYTQMHEANIAFEALVSSELSPYALKDPSIQGPLLEPKWKTRVVFCADKVGFHLETLRLGKEPALYSFSYNGSTYETFLGPDSVLEVSKKSAKVPPAVWNADPLVLPAAGLAKSRNIHRQIDCLWRDVTDPLFWTQGAAGFQAAAGQFSGKVDGNRVVFFPAEGGSSGALPGWESFQGTTDKPWKKYTCSETGEVSFDDNGKKAAFSFPRKAVLQMFYETGELARTDILEITKLEVNDPGFKEARFTVDPSAVAHTYDTDSQRWIKTGH